MCRYSRTSEIYSNPKFVFSCSKPEQKPNIPIGKLQKEIKSVELRAEQDIEKLQEKLEKAKVLYMFQFIPKSYQKRWTCNIVFVNG